MGVERVDYYSDQEFELAQQQEEEAFRLDLECEQEQVPDVVPCSSCRREMYQDSPHPEDNLCSDCKKIVKTCICGKCNTEPKVTCLHEMCPTCGGTGKRKDGLGSCVHMISCPCPKCSPR